MRLDITTPENVYEINYKDPKYSLKSPDYTPITIPYVYKIVSNDEQGILSDIKKYVKELVEYVNTEYFLKRIKIGDHFNTALSPLHMLNENKILKNIDFGEIIKHEDLAIAPTYYEAVLDINIINRVNVQAPIYDYNPTEKELKYIISRKMREDGFMTNVISYLDYPVFSLTRMDAGSRTEALDGYTFINYDITNNNIIGEHSIWGIKSFKLNEYYFNNLTLRDHMVEIIENKHEEILNNYLYEEIPPWDRLKNKLFG